MAKKRNTKTKELVWKVMENSESALTHDDITQSLRGEMDRVTIYRILQGFEEEGLVHKVIDSAGKSHYAICRHCTEHHHHDNHMHFQCVTCGVVNCLNKEVRKPNMPEGYTVEEINYLVTGCCPDCRDDKD